MHIAIAGLGRMGAAIGARLLELDHQVTVWNRTPAKLQPLLDAGAVAAATPKDVVRQAETVITMLTDATALDAVYDGDNGLLAGDARGTLFIDMSTVRPQAVRDLAAKVTAKGGAFVECPVGGSVAPARTGKLLGLAGADDADFARAKPILDQLCRRLEHVGPVGAGASMKLAINLPLLVYWRAFAEALSLCKHLGGDPVWLIDLFADTSGGTNGLKARGPALAAALAGRDPGPTTFDVDSIRKDLRTMLDEAATLGVDLPVVASALGTYDGAARDGWGSRDVTSLMSYWLGDSKSH
jgi:3-hydroxyisobutyrate dehydrogenase